MLAWCSPDGKEVKGLAPVHGLAYVPVAEEQQVNADKGDHERADIGRNAGHADSAKHVVDCGWFHWFLLMEKVEPCLPADDPHQHDKAENDECQAEDARYGGEHVGLHAIEKGGANHRGPGHGQ